MPAFILIVCAWLLLLICFSSEWVMDVLLALLGWEGGHQLDGLGLIVLLALLGSALACVAAVFAAISLYRRRQVAWNVAALLLSLPGVFFALNFLLVITRAYLEVRLD